MMQFIVEDEGLSADEIKTLRSLLDGAKRRKN
jgi:hypothetical protein